MQSLSSLQPEILSSMSPKYRLIASLLNSTDLRLCDILKLKFGAFDYENRLLHAEGRVKAIFLEQDMHEALRAHVEEVNPTSLDAFVFESPVRKGKPLDRLAVNKYFARFAQKQELEHISPKVLKQLPKGDTTAQNAKPSRKTLLNLVNLAKEQDASIALNLAQVAEIQTAFIGRSKELQAISNLLARGVNVIITGETGTGKSTLLEQVQYPKPVIHLADTKDFKKSLINAILHLLNGDLEELKMRIFGEDTDLYATASKENLVNLAKILCSIVPKNAYILKIGDVQDITPTVVRTLKEQLADHFTIIATARELRKDRSDWIWNFERIELKNFKRTEATALIFQLCQHLPIEDFVYLKNRVFETTAGNPRMIFQICERLGKEFGLIQNATIEKVCLGYLGRQTKDIDMSFFFLALCIAVFLVIWHNTGAERELLKFARYGIFIVLIFGRAFFRNFKRKIL